MRFFRSDKFVLVQLLLGDYNEEKALLFYLQGLLASKEWLITFNGKTFDWPLLRTRFILIGLGGEMKSFNGHLASLARIYKRLGDWDAEEKTLLELLNTRRNVGFKPYIELAKLYEHKRKDFFKARSWAQMGLANTFKKGSEASWAINDLDYRLARLERKINN